MVWPSARDGLKQAQSPRSREAMTIDIIGRHVSELSGYAPAMPTPFDNDGNVDSAAFEQFCHRQIDQGATALVVCGTTGEAPTLNRAEHGALVRLAVGAACGRIPVIAGAGSNSTAHAIELSKDAEAAGADAGCPSCRTTTSQPKQACLRISAPSLNRADCRSFSMTFQLVLPAARR
jgi:hypothetical protein